MNQSIQKPKAKITIGQKTEILKNVLQATNIIYQPHVGYLVFSKREYISMKELNDLASSLELRVILFGLSKEGHLKILLEIVQ